MKFLDRILGDDFSRLGALGALLALSVVLIHVPIVIYSTNSDEFTFSATEYFLLGFSLLLVAISIFRLSIAVMPRKMRKIYSGLIVSLALYIWLSSYFLVSDFGLLDGEGLNIEISSKYSMYDLFLACAIFLLVFCVAIRKTKPFIYLLVFLNVGLATITIVDVLSDDKQASLSRGVDLDPLFRFSQQGNVLIVLMDTFQSDIFADLIAENPDLKESFDGFTFFKNTLGVAPTTYLTMPAIHSGIEYYGSRSLHEYYDEAVHRRSFLSGLVDSGYEGSLINPIQGVCPRDLSLCVGSGLIFQDKMGQLIYEASKLFDIAIFRSAPFFLKADIYNNGNFRLSAATRPQHIPHAVVEGNRVLEEIGSRMVVEGGRPSVKFVHLMNTHPPFVLDDECEFVNEAQPMDRPHMTIQARCAVTAFLGLMNQLKQHDLYDDTVVMLIADTGYGSGPGIGSSYTGELGQQLPRWADLVGGANPIFLVKPMAARGTLRESDRSVHIADVAATVCDLVEACDAASGQPAFSATPDQIRTRRYNHYIWRHEYWERDVIPAITTYDVEGPLWNRESWPDRTGASYRIGQLIDFTMEGDGRAYLASGWSGSEHWGTWSLGETAVMLLRPEHQAASDLILRVRARGFVAATHPTVNVGVLVNGVAVGEWVFSQGETESEHSLLVPNEVANRERVIRIAFDVSHPKSPAELGLSADARELGIGISQMQIVEAEDTYSEHMQ